MGKSTTDAPEVQQGQGDTIARIGEGLEAEVIQTETLKEGEEPTEAPLFPYQEKAIPKLVGRIKTPLLSPPGSGKTRMLLAAWRLAGEPMPLLIFVGKNGSAEWTSQIPRWVGEKYLQYVKILSGMSAVKRRKLYTEWEANPHEPLIIITTWQAVYKDKWFENREWPCVIFDEAQKLFNHKSQVSKFIYSLKTNFLWLATGTEMRKGPQNMYSLLNLCDRRLFKSYWKFVYTWCEIDEGYYGKEIIGAKNVENFQKLILGQHSIHIPEEVVSKYLPEKQIITLHYEMSTSQKRYYDSLEQEVITIIQESGKIELGALAISRLVKVRQLMCCPKIIDPSLDIGGGMELIMERIQEDPEDPVVIFVPFTAAIPHLEAYVAEKLPDHYVGHLQGGMSPEEVKAQIAHFSTSHSVMFISIAFGESFSITNCKTAYMLGNTFMPDVYKQATDRIRRASTIHKRVTIHNLVCPNTCDVIVEAVRGGYKRTIDKALGYLLKHTKSTT